MCLESLYDWTKNYTDEGPLFPLIGALDLEYMLFIWNIFFSFFFFFFFNYTLTSGLFVQPQTVMFTLIYSVAVRDLLNFITVETFFVIDFLVSGCIVGVCYFLRPTYLDQITHHSTSTVLPGRQPNSRCIFRFLYLIYIKPKTKKKELKRVYFS